MKAKDLIRDNNVDATRSTMQRKVNSLHRQLSKQMEAAWRKNRKLNHHKAFIFRLIAAGTVTKQQYKEFITCKKESPLKK